MLGEITTDHVDPEQLFVAYCVKSPKKKIEFVVHYEWNTLPSEFKGIFLKQLSAVLKGKLHEYNQLVTPGNIDLPFDEIAFPDGYTLATKQDVSATLSNLTHETLSHEEFMDNCTQLAGRYLVAPRSQENAYIVLRFHVNRSGLDNVPMIFVTLVDLEPERKEPRIDVDKAQLALQTVKHAFQTRDVVKGAVFPYYTFDNRAFEKTASLLLYEREGVEYWPLAFGAGALPIETERFALQQAVKSSAYNPRLKTVAKISECLAASDAMDIPALHQAISSSGISIQQEEVQRVVAEAINSRVSATQRHSSVVAQPVFRSKRILKRMKIKHGSANIEVEATRLNDMEYFQHNGEFYLVIKSQTRPQVESLGITLMTPRTWDSYKRLLDQGIDDTDTREA